MADGEGYAPRRCTIVNGASSYQCHTYGADTDEQINSPDEDELRQAASLYASEAYQLSDDGMRHSYLRSGAMPVLTTAPVSLHRALFALYYAHLCMQLFLFFEKKDRGKARRTALLLPL